MRKVLIGSVLLAAGWLAAGSALAEERCSGTLCDLYYGSAPPPSGDAGAAATAKPAATPLTVPTTGTLFGGMFGRGSGATPGQPAAQATAAPASPTRTVPPSPTASSNNDYMDLNGGGLLNWGRPSGRCTGTLCDVAYGGSAPEPAPSATASVGSQTAAVSPGSVPPANIVIPQEAPRPHCSGGDPWHCYRK